jgi:hypothetical protein
LNERLDLAFEPNVVLISQENDFSRAFLQGTLEIAAHPQRVLFWPQRP